MKNTLRITIVLLTSTMIGSTSTQTNSHQTAFGGPVPICLPDGTCIPNRSVIVK